MHESLVSQPVAWERRPQDVLHDNCSRAACRTARYAGPAPIARQPLERLESGVLTRRNSDTSLPNISQYIQQLAIKFGDIAREGRAIASHHALRKAEAAVVEDPDDLIALNPS